MKVHKIYETTLNGRSCLLTKSQVNKLEELRLKFKSTQDPADKAEYERVYFLFSRIAPVISVFDNEI
jgi:hypothetical protein